MFTIFGSITNKQLPSLCICYKYLYYIPTRRFSGKTRRILHEFMRLSPPTYMMLQSNVFVRFCKLYFAFRGARSALV